MTSNERPPDSGRLTLKSMRRTALVAGVLYLITFASSIEAAASDGMDDSGSAPGSSIGLASEAGPA